MDGVNEKTKLSKNSRKLETIRKDTNNSIYYSNLNIEISSAQVN